MAYRVNPLSVIVVLISFFLPSCGPGDLSFEQGHQKKIPTPQELSNKRQAEADAKGVITLDFKAGEIDSTSIEMIPDFGVINQNLTLFQKPLTHKTYKQIERTLNTFSFSQGHDGDLVNDEFEVLQAGKVDILIVVDDSQTMASIQESLAESLPELLNHIQNHNWQIAINTTTSSCLRKTADDIRILTKNRYLTDPGGVIDDYKELIKVGTTGDNFERGIRSAGQGLLGECPGGDFNWRREDAKPVVLIVSDEKNCGSSSNEGCSGEDYATYDYVTSRVANVRVYALLLLTEYADECPDIGGYENYYPQEYIDLVDATGGFYDGICQENYDNIMSNISLDVSKQVLKKFMLSHEPSDSPVLEVDGVVVHNKFTLTGKIVQMVDDLPDTATDLKIIYHHSAMPRIKSYDLTGNPDPRTILVMVNGKSLPQAAHQYHKDLLQVDLLDMPEDRAKIEISFRDNSPLLMNFLIDENAALNTLEVSIGGNKTTGFGLSDNSAEIIFDPPPLDGQEISLIYEQEFDRQVSYGISVVDYNLIDVVVIEDKISLLPIPFSLVGDKIVFPEEEVFFDREVLITYKMNHTPEQLNFKVPVAMEPIDGSVEVLTDDQIGICKKEGEIEQDIMNLQCEDDDFSRILIQFDYVVDYQNTFNIGSLELSEILVYVNGQVLNDFILSNEGMITIDPVNLPVGAKVKIAASLAKGE